MTSSLNPTKSWIKTHWFKVLCLTAGLALIVLFQLGRAPRLFNGIWGDEAENNYTFLAANSSLHDLSKNVCYMFKPVLDFALKKWVWFKIVTPTEAGLAILPWLFSGISLLLVLFVPWTEFMELRILGVLLFGICELEYAYSTEAQLYSFASLLSWITLFGIGGAISRVRQKKFHAALWFFLLSLGCGLNAHFFAWPYVGMAGLIFMTVYMLEVPNGQKQLWFWRLVLGTAAVVGSTIIINIYSLYMLFICPQELNDKLILNVPRTLDYLHHFWGTINIPRALYGSVSLAALFHPSWSKRRLAWISAIAMLPCLLITIVMATARSSYPISNRYLITYLAPVYMLFFLGLEGAVCRIQIHKKHFLRPILFAGIFLFATSTGVYTYFIPAKICKKRNFSIAPLAALPTDALKGINAFRSNPMNYSVAFKFFDQVKSLHRPALVLCNQSWVACLPQLYVDYLGQKPVGRTPVLNVEGFETSPATLARELKDFFEHDRDNGIVVVFFSDHGTTKPHLTGQEDFRPFALGAPTEPGEYWAIYNAKDIEAWAQQFIINKPLIDPPRPQLPPLTFFLRKKLMPIFFYLGPVLMWGTFLFVLYPFSEKRKATALDNEIALTPAS